MFPIFLPDPAWCSVTYESTTTKYGAVLPTEAALIAEDGLWTGYDWYDNEYEIGILNGEPYSDNPDV